MKEDMLIIDWNSYGSLTDSYKWCEYLREKYNITLLTSKKHDSIPAQSGITHHTVLYDNSSIIKKIKARILFILSAFWLTLQSKGKIFVVYYPSCFWLQKILFWKKIHLDIRTLSVNKDLQRREKYNRKLYKACKTFTSVSAISEGIKAKIGRKDIDILPLGADIISNSQKQYDSEIRLIYIGTLKARDIPKTIEGTFLFHKIHPEVKIKYDIIGSGSEQDNQDILDSINKFKLGGIVTYHGYMTHSQCEEYLDTANIGCAFVPMTDYFEYQPPTKIFEYAMSGLYTIATKTKANTEYISYYNGDLIEDTAKSFCHALENYLLKRKQLDERKIRNSLKQFSWESIVNNYLIPLLKEK